MTASEYSQPQQVTLPNLIGKNGLFSDGDWVESKDQDPTGNVRLIQLADIGVGEYINKSNRFMTSEKAEKLRCTYLKPGDILIARMPDPIGRACIFPGDVKPCVTVVDVCILRPDQSIVDTNWLLHRINSPGFIHEIKQWITGTTRQRISRSNLSTITFSLPPITEQKCIAAILDKADAIRRKRQQAIKLADDFLRAAFLDMFGDPVANPKSFNFKLLNTLYSTKKSGTKCGPFGSALKKHEYVKTGIPVWTMDNIQENQFIEEGCLFITEDKFEGLEAYAVDEDDILISRAGTVGKMCIAMPSAKKSIISTNLIRLSLDSEQIEPTYFVCLMSFFKGKVGRLKTGEDDAYSFMNTGSLNQLSIPLPPIQLQKQYTEIVARVNRIQDSKYNSKIGFDDLFNSLTHRAFRGDL